MPVRESLLHHAHCRSAQERKRRDSRNALSAHRDPRVEYAFQVDAQLGCILGQSLHATPCVVGLLPPQALRPPRHGVWAEAVLISCSCRGNVAFVDLTRFPGFGAQRQVPPCTNLGEIGAKRTCREGQKRVDMTKMSSRPEEFHLRALPEPCMTLSSHTAPDVRPWP